MHIAADAFFWFRKIRFWFQAVQADRFVVLKSKNVVKNKFLINLHPFGCRLQPTLVAFWKFEFWLQAAQAGCLVVFESKPGGYNTENSECFRCRFRCVRDWGWAVSVPFIFLKAKGALQPLSFSPCATHKATSPAPQNKTRKLTAPVKPSPTAQRPQRGNVAVRQMRDSPEYRDSPAPYS